MTPMTPMTPIIPTPTTPPAPDAWQPRVQISWTNPHHDWPWFILLATKGEWVYLQGADAPDGSATHAGDRFWAHRADIKSMECTDPPPVSASTEADLRRWKSTHAPRLEALQALLETAQREAAEGVEARATLASEREANARLTAELEEAQRHAAATDAALADLRGELWEERRQHDITRGVLEMARMARDKAMADLDALRANSARQQNAEVSGRAGAAGEGRA